MSRIVAKLRCPVCKRVEPFIEVSAPFKEKRRRPPRCYMCSTCRQHTFEVSAK